MCKYLHDLLRSAFWKGLVLFVASLPAAARLPASPEQRVQTAVTAQGQSDSALQGRLIVAGSEGLRLSTSGGDIVVTSDNPQILHTLQDTHLMGRQLRLEGGRTSNGEFNANHIFTVRDGKLYRLRYYCHVCNIPATEPGPCVCCQRPTELEEIPIDQVTHDMVLVP
jgi:hypothetical protein